MLYFFLYAKGLLTNPFFADTAADVCDEGGDFFGFPRWYKYLKVTAPTIDGDQVCTPRITGINDLWLVVLAVIEILLRIAILISIVFVLIGGIKFITSRGNPEKLSGARNAVQDALIGLVIAITATAVVSFIAGRFSS